MEGRWSQWNNDCSFFRMRVGGSQLYRALRGSWLHRAEQSGFDFLAERSRRPHTCPHAIPPELTAHLLEARRRRPTWGPRKVLALVQARRASAAKFQGAGRTKRRGYMGITVHYEGRARSTGDLQRILEIVRDLPALRVGPFGKSRSRTVPLSA